MELDGEEQLVLVAEVRGKPDEATRKQVLEALRTAVSAEHGLELQAVLLLLRGLRHRANSQRLRCWHIFVSKDTLDWNRFRRLSQRRRMPKVM